ncbi:MAG: flagellar type III secretion system pore protein FliP [Planctomycetota bacterium]|nr:flagellar type III secretion system pore protein FliP [Planctomycetota bacterium]
MINRRVIFYLAAFAALLVSGAFAAQGPISLLDGPLTGGGETSPAGPERLSTAVEIALLLTVLSLLPAVLVTITSFTRIVIVLSFVRRALSVNELPPNPVLMGLALFLTMFVMAPVGKAVHAKAWVPYQAGELAAADALDATWTEFSVFLVSNTRPSELELFQQIANGDTGDDNVVLAGESRIPGISDTDQEVSVSDLPARVVIPAFVLSELKTAFQMGFLLFLPFLVIDLVVSSVLLSMGMFMLPPVMISTPIKILIFVLVDGWHLICQSVVTSFVVG